MLYANCGIHTFANIKEHKSGKIVKLATPTWQEIEFLNVLLLRTCIIAITILQYISTTNNKYNNDDTFYKESKYIMPCILSDGMHTTLC